MRGRRETEETEGSYSEVFFVRFELYLGVPNKADRSQNGEYFLLDF